MLRISDSDFIKLKNRIDLEPSVLYLGEKCRMEYAGDNSDAVSPLFSCRWGIVYSERSSNDIIKQIGDNVNCRIIDIYGSKINYKRDFCSKKRLNIVYLNDFPDGAGDSLSLEKHKMRIDSAFRWIYERILCDYGVMVVDGWGSRTGFFSALFKSAFDMPKHSIYMFGVSEDDIQSEEFKDVSLLRESGILQVDSRSFSDVFTEVFGMALLGVEISASEGQSITIQNDNGSGSTVIHVPYSAVSGLDISISILHDAMWNPRADKYEDRISLFSKFLQQDDKPIFRFYGDEYDFYFKRNIDDELYAKVLSAFEQKAVERKAIRIIGNSNSGKTACLVNLANRLRKDMPVIFICGMPTQEEWEENLKRFIKKYITGIRHGGRWIEKVAVIWDGGHDYHIESKYYQLQNYLRECNVLLIGSEYKFLVHSSDKNIVILPDVLKKNETFEVLKMLERTDGRFKSILEQKMIDNTHIGAKCHILTIMRQVGRLLYNEEWRKIKELLKGRFSTEVRANEQYTIQQIDYIQSQVREKGFASAWQIKLDIIRQQLSDAGEREDEGICDDGAMDQRTKWENFRNALKQINSILAVAGVFSVDIPLTLVFHIIKRGDTIDVEGLEVIEKMLSSDALIRFSRDEYGYPIVNFRHPEEAQYYIEENLGNKHSEDERRKEEVDILLEVIRSCDWDDDRENRTVIQLVRAFGPNSLGRYEDRDQIEDNSGHYREYKNWWKIIADELYSVSEDYAESVHVWAHLIRSYCREKYQVHELSYDEGISLLDETRVKLKEIIDNGTYISETQHTRILGEVCSNVTFSMKIEEDKKKKEALFAILKRIFPEVVRMNQDISEYLGKFSTSNLLNIWLDGVNNYFEVLGNNTDIMRNPKGREVVWLSLDYIHKLMNISAEDNMGVNYWNNIDRILNLVDVEFLEDLKNKLEKSNNDSYLFLSAWKAFSMDCNDANIINPDIRIRAAYKNLFLLPEDFAPYEEYKNELEILKERAIERTKGVIDFLEENMSFIENSRSYKCLYMLIWSKWLYYTGDVIMNMDQKPGLTYLQWREIGDLCEKYIQYCGEDENPRAGAILLRMVYIWCFHKKNDEFYELRNKQKMLKSNLWYFNRICVCEDGSRKEKLFHVDVGKKHIDGKDRIYALIRGCVGKDDDVAKNILKKEAYIPDSLYHTITTDEKSNAVVNVMTPMSIWFNLKGPLIKDGRKTE